MTGSEWLIVYVILSAAIFTAWDVYRQLTGQETMSRKVINLSYQYKWIAALALLFSCFLAGVGIWLMFHWESLCILFDFACELSRKI